ncbi:hypothetical protein CDAR_1291 [Caerostris darwini]|uniref:Uncharacterized protein n=1 Tax=Caerostris darwini TaxID=1538125 RepID=A0AAV4U193_9ARAC|nr:hypothetical protein CDAR_1291 [Caerostris darwini]
MDAIAYNVWTPSSSVAKQKVDINVNELWKNDRFYIMWDCDSKLAEDMYIDPQAIQSDPVSKSCIVGGKKPMFFHYRVPDCLRRYYMTVILCLLLLSNQRGESFLKKYRTLLIFVYLML